MPVRMFSVLIVGMLLAHGASAQQLPVSLFDPAGQSPARTAVIELAQIPAVQVSAKSETGQTAVYTCAALQQVLAQAGTAFGEAMRGKRVAEYVVAQAQDGYRVVFSLAELDPAFFEHDVWVCYQKDGQVIAPSEGPLRLVIPGEKRHARWLRQLQEISIKSAAQP